jgi:hypothetical protein
MKLTAENRSTRRNTYPSATLSTTNPTWTDPGSNPSLIYISPSCSLSYLDMIKTYWAILCHKILLLLFIILHLHFNPPPHLAQQPLVGQGLLIIEASQSHSLDTPHSVGRLLPSDQPDTRKRQPTVLPTGFESTIPASERP